MSWLRVGDTISGDPLVLALEDPADPLWRSACLGTFLALAALSAQHDSAYVVHATWVRVVAGARGEDVMRALVAAGLATALGGRGARRSWCLVDDRPDLIHIRPRAERDWELTRKRDTKNPRLLAPVLLRDGDACRYCGRTVNPADHRSGRGRTLDHLAPGRPAETADDLVVACLECNGARGRDWQDEARRTTFHERWPLLPVPDPLLFQDATATWLADRGLPIPDGSTVIPSRATARAARAADRADARTTALAARTTPPASSSTTSTTTSPQPPATSDPGSEVPSLAPRAGATAPTGRKAPTKEPHSAVQAGAAASRGSTTSPEEQHRTRQVPAAASETSTTSTTASPAPPAPPAAPRRTADERPATPSPTDLEDLSRTSQPDAHPRRTHGCGGDGPGRVGSGRVPDAPPGSPPSTPPPEQPAPAPPRRRGRRRPRPPGATG